jgi:hypothetical protein
MVRRVGSEGEPVMVIDGVLADAAALVDCAAASAFAPAHGPAGGYPGLRAPAPLDYVETVVRTLAAPIAEAFALGAARPARAECNFSLVTLAPDALVPAQRAPHIDTVDPWQFAILHYLCAPQFGGTSFFRHRVTGFETLSEARLADYDAVRAAEPDEPGYVVAGGRWFDAIGEVEAQSNRLVIYRSRLLHSGRILAPELLTADPRTGRLTANIFLTMRPAQ